MRGRETVDVAMYGRALAVLVRNPIIILFPILGAIVEIGAGYLRAPLFDPIGGNDFGFFNLLFQLIEGFAFALAIIAAETAWRNRRPSFSATWDEGRSKAGSILLATIGFFFIIVVAGIFGGYLGPLGLILSAVAFYFLIYTIPAAAIGGVPGGAALSASIQRVRGNYVAAAVLAIVSIVLYWYVVGVLSPYITAPLGPLERFATPIIRAVVIAYLAVVYARQYDDVAFFRPY